MQFRDRPPISNQPDQGPIDVIVACLSVEQVESEHTRHGAPISEQESPWCKRSMTLCEPSEARQIAKGYPKGGKAVNASDQVQVIRLCRICRFASPFYQRCRAVAGWRGCHLKRTKFLRGVSGQHNRLLPCRCGIVARRGNQF